jgi:predicted dehydrogenase
MASVKLGVIGCGNISGIYFSTTKKLKALELVACADLIPERAKAAAEEYAIPKVLTPEKLLADPEIEIVLNLTVPKAHAGVALAAIEAGKSVYGEKPLAVTRADGKKIMEAAKAKKVLVGSAPDTFLGAGIQTCRKLIDDGWIGDPIGATAYMMSHGPESWHPNAGFYYEVGGGPMFDMGPYYLTALINLLGPVKRVSGSTRASFSERIATSKELYGKVLKVEIPTHVTGVLDFASGPIGMIITSFDVWAHHMPNIEIYGSRGTIRVPDPNTFGGPVQLWVNGEWKDIPLSHSYPDNSRGLGVADMAAAIRSGRPHRASGDLAFHVLDIMQAVHESSASGSAINLSTTCKQPAQMPMDLLDGEVEN